MLQRIIIHQIKGLGNIVNPEKIRKAIAHFIGACLFLLMFFMMGNTPEPKPIEAEVILPVQKKKETKKDPRILAYIKRFDKVAEAEEEKFGIPKSIKLAQGILESNYGTSFLADAHNNHFGLKCFSRKCQKTHCVNLTDDSHKDFFRAYKSAWESWRDHSQFLNGPRYKHLHKIPASDYKAWAKGLKKAGYATDKKYADKLIKIIEHYGLNR